MKNLMMCLMFLLPGITGVNAQKSISSNKEIMPLMVAENENLSSLDNVVINSPIGILDNTIKDFELTVYPNPVSTNLTVSFDCASLLMPEPVYLYVIDMRGRVVIVLKDMMYPGSTYRKDLDIRILPDDEYVFQLIKGNIKTAKKFQVYY